MYLSHPVRRIRDTPTEGETVVLRVTAVDDTAADRVATRVEAVGTVEERLRFSGLRVAVPQKRVADICTFEGIEAIETANTLQIDPDGAGEDAVDGRESVGVDPETSREESGNDPDAQ